MNYRFKTTPRIVQAEDLERAWGKPAWGRFWEMRVGKGVGTIYEMDAYAHAEMARRFVVVCPKRVISTWQDMIPVHAWTDFRVLTDYRKLTETDNYLYPTILLTNYERVWEIVTDGHGRRSLVLRREIADWAPEFVVADEAHRVKNRTASRSRAIYVLGRMARYRRALTGTPDPTNYADYYGIFKFLDPSVFGTWAAFAGRYLMLDWYKQVIGYRNVEELGEKVRAHSSRVLRSECLEVPIVEDVTQHVTLSPQIMSVYDSLAEQMFAELEPEGSVSAPIILTKLLRLAQITSGYVRRDDEELQWLHGTKVDALMEVLDEALVDAGAKVVVFFRFHPEMDRVAQALQAARIRHLRLDGQTRDDAIVKRAFRDEPQVRVLLCQVASGSLGLDLSSAATAVFYSWDFDAGTYDQARSRIWKPAEHPGDKVTFIHLLVPDSIDSTMLKVVQGKMERSAMLLDRWEELVRGKAA